MKEVTENTPPKGKQITLSEEHEVLNWTSSLGCSERELREALAAVGNSAEKVRKYLAKRRWARGLAQLSRET